MRIDKVALVNICQHEKRSDVFGPGVIGVLGPNGSGKSNYLKAIRRAFTGDSGNVGKNEDDLRWGSEKGSIQVDFSVGPNKGTIKRDVKTARCTMKYVDRQFGAASEVDLAIYDILGVRKRVLSNIIFVPQGQIEGILFQRPAERAKELQALFGTEEAEKIRDFLQTEITHTTCESRAPAISELQARLKTLAEQMTAVTQQRDTWRPHIMADVEEKSLEELITRHEAQLRAVALNKQQTDSVEKTQQDLLTTTATLDKRQRSLQDLSAIVQELEPELISAREILRLAAAAQATFTYRENLTARIRQYQFRLQDPEPKAPQTDEGSIGIKRDTLSALKAGVDVSKQILALAAIGSPTCPTCKQNLDTNHVLTHQMQLASTEPEYIRLHDEVARAEYELHQYRQAHSKWSHTVTSIRAELDFAEKELARLTGAQPISDASIKAATETVSMHGDAVVSLQTVQRDIAALSATVSALAAALQQARQNQEGLTQSLGAPVSGPEYEQALRLLKQSRQAAAKVAEAEGQLGILTKQHDDMSKQLQEYLEQEKQLAPIAKWKGMLERVRGILHRDQYPNLVAQEYLGPINFHLAKYLELFQVPFTTRLLPDNAIECSFSANKSVPAERLSGGQRVMLGIAFRFAIYDVFVSNLGLMILDEPTVWLDDDHVDLVVQLLDRVKSYSKGAGLQLIVVTHEKQLVDVFDQVIQL